MNTRVEPLRAGLAILTAVALAAALVLVVGIGSARADHFDTWPDSNEANHEDFWEQWGADNEGENDWTCIKDETGSDEPYVIGDPPSGEFWRLLVLKAGSDINDLHWNPSPGDSFEHSVQGGWSHVILCSRPFPDTTPAETTTTVAETTTTVADTTTTTIPDDVLGTVITTSTTAPVVQVTTTIPDEVLDTAVEAEELPFTGLESDQLIGLAVLLLAGGLIALGVTGRREDA